MYIFTTWEDIYTNLSWVSVHIKSQYYIEGLFMKYLLLLLLISCGASEPVQKAENLTFFEKVFGKVEKRSPANSDFEARKEFVKKHNKKIRDSYRPVVVGIDKDGKEIYGHLDDIKKKAAKKKAAQEKAARNKRAKEKLAKERLAKS